MRIRLVVLAPLLALALSSCAHTKVQTATATAPTLAGDPAHPGRTQGWVDTKLYFGLGPLGPDGQAGSRQQGVSETEWRAFLDREVTPRFPSGLSVLDVYGQWQGKQESAPERLRTKLLIIDYPDTQENRDKIEAIRAAWKQKTGDQSVMRVTEPADVSF
jgi:hypothetical protein